MCVKAEDLAHHRAVLRCVFRPNVTADFGIVTGDFGKETEPFRSIVTATALPIAGCGEHSGGAA